ncbi:hypothetical protein BC1002_4291 [Paraburkholderia atlantica]|uniref:Uncharacterized protein n=1 Tax=Paraburkholderia atlantica TaxID=2654982 RepID=D5WII1_PARAM|nr:hypothetical protein BC1002_4291 [Paraburkholderia atlantica]
MSSFGGISAVAAPRAANTCALRSRALDSHSVRHPTSIPTSKATAVVSAGATPCPPGSMNQIIASASMAANTSIARNG